MMKTIQTHLKVAILAILLPSALSLISPSNVQANIVQATVQSGNVQSKEGATLTGTVLFQKGNTPAEFVAVALYKIGETTPTTGAITISDGSFTLENIEAGRYYIGINSLEITPFNSEEFKITPKQSLEGSSISKKYLVERSVAGIDEVQVVARQKKVINRIDRQIIVPEANKTAAGGTAIDLLSASPSVSVDLEGGVSLRGSSSFTVLVDGRPALSSGSDALAQIPVETISTVEIITNPSAKYNAEGTSGIINIVTKRSKGTSLGSYISVMGSSAESWKTNLLVSLQKGDVRHRIGAELINSRRRSDFNQIKSTFNSTNYITYEAASEGPRVGNRDIYLGRYGIDFLSKDEKSASVTVDVEAASTSNGYWGDLIYNEKQYQNGYGMERQEIYSGSFTSRDFKDLAVDYVAGTATFNKPLRRDGSELDASIYLRYGDCIEYFENRKRDIDSGELAGGQNSWEDEFRWTIQGDLNITTGIGNEDDEAGKLDIGYQFYSYLEDGLYTMEQYSVEEQKFTPRPEYTSKFKFKRDINSLYAVWRSNIKALDYQVGLRAEYTNRFIAGKGDVPDNKEERLDLFPSIHLSNKVGDRGVLSASYGRRTVRPRLHYMEPYITYADSYTARTGNPAVRPEYINNFDLGFIQKLGESDKSSFGVTGFYRVKTDKIERIRTVYKDNITLDSISNVGNDYSLGVEIMANVDIVPWWNLNINSSLYSYRIESDYKFNEFDDKSFNWYVSMANSMDLWRDGSLQFDTRYVGPSVSTQGTREAYYYSILAIQQKMLKRKLQATLKVNDLFATAQYQDSQITPEMNTQTDINPQSPLVVLTLSYHINDLKKKSKKDGDYQFEGAGY